MSEDPNEPAPDAPIGPLPPRFDVGEAMRNVIKHAQAVDQTYLDEIKESNRRIRLSMVAADLVRAEERRRQAGYVAESQAAEKRRQDAANQQHQSIVALPALQERLIDTTSDVVNELRLLGDILQQRGIQEEAAGALAQRTATRIAWLTFVLVVLTGVIGALTVALLLKH